MPPEPDTRDLAIIDVLRTALPDVFAIYRFGSSADGTTHRGSDIDVAILALQERLAARLSRDVDLVDLATATPVMAIQVVAHGTLLLDGDPAARGHFEDRTFSAYARLNEERRAILERVRSEGTVYGR